MTTTIRRTLFGSFGSWAEPYPSTDNHSSVPRGYRKLSRSRLLEEDFQLQLEEKSHDSIRESAKGLSSCQVASFITGSKRCFLQRAARYLHAFYARLFNTASCVATWTSSALERGGRCHSFLACQVCDVFRSRHA